MIGKTRWDLPAHMIDPDGVAELTRKLDSHEPFKNHHQKIRAPDGSVHHYRVSGVPMFDANGLFLGYRGSTVDETAEVAAQEMATDIQRQFFEAMETISEGFAMWGADETFVYCNSHFRTSHAGIAETLERGRTYPDFLRALAESGERPDSDGRASDRRGSSRLPLPHAPLPVADRQRERW